MCGDSAMCGVCVCVCVWAGVCVWAWAGAGGWAGGRRRRAGVRVLQTWANEGPGSAGHPGVVTGHPLSWCSDGRMAATQAIIRHVWKTGS